MYKVSDFKSDSGKDVLAKNLDKLSKKRPNLAYAAGLMIEDLKCHGRQVQRCIFKLLDSKSDLWELKKSGTQIRIGVYVDKEGSPEEFVLLDLYIKKRDDVDQNTIDSLKAKITLLKQRKNNGKN